MIQIKCQTSFSLKNKKMLSAAVVIITLRIKESVTEVADNNNLLKIFL